MKKINLLITLLFTVITYSQMITYTSVRLDDGQNDAYVDVEKFWSKIHEQAINDDLETGWMIWKVIPVEGDENAANQPDFLIMNFYKYHIFFCLNQRGDGEQCCMSSNAEPMFDYMKKKIKSLKSTNGII